MIKKFFSNKILSIKITLLLHIIFIQLKCTVIIPFKYLHEKESNGVTPREIMSEFMSENIYVALELGSPRQEIHIPIQFNENIFSILNEASAFPNLITNKIYNDTKSTTFKSISKELEYDYGTDFSIFKNCTDVFYFLKDSKNKKYHNKIELVFRQIYNDKNNNLGSFGLQIYPSKEGGETNIPSLLKSLIEKNINKNYLWSIHFSKEGNNIGDEGYLLLGEYPHDIDYNIGFYDSYEFDRKNFRTLYDHSNQKTMNHEIQMSEIYFYNDKNNKDNSNQNYFNDLKKSDFLKDIVIPQVSIYYVTKFDFNFGGILIPEYFNTYLESKVFNSYVTKGKCFKEKIYVQNSPNFFYCKNENSLIKDIKQKIPTIIFVQEHLKYNFTININDLVYKKNDYVYFLLFYSSSQKNKWTLGKPFLKKYPFVFNPDSKDIGFYSSFLLNGIKYKTAIIIIVVFSIIFIIIGLLIGRKKYKIHKIKKQQALEMSNNNFISDYKSIEMNTNNQESKLYTD